MVVELIRSQTWMDDNFKNITDILDETIREFVSEEYKIINIETKERNGLTRFWIYIIKPEER